MKKKLLQSTGLLIIIISLILYCTGCSLKPYVCEYTEKDTEDIVTEKDTTRNYVFQIGQSTYNTQYVSSRKSISKDDILFDMYVISESSSDLLTKHIRTDSETGKIVGFYDITPYPNIENIDSMSDDQLKEVVETMLGDLVADFTRYNHFELTRPQSPNNTYHLKWQVKRELPCAISVDVRITADGLIREFSITDDCPNDLTKPFLSTSERNELLEEKIIEDLGVDSMDGVEYKILSEVLTYYKSAPAITYLVEIMENGFSHCISLTIYQTNNN